MVYIVYMKGKLMKDSATECVDPPSNSEMAVSLVTNGNASGLKRPAEEDLRETENEEIETKPIKLVSTAFLSNKKFKKDDVSTTKQNGEYYNNNGLDSDGGSLKPASDQESDVGSLKPASDPESETEDHDKSNTEVTEAQRFTYNQDRYGSPMNPPCHNFDNETATVEPTDPSPQSSPMKAPQQPYPCKLVGGQNGTETSSSSPQPPTLQPINIIPQGFAEDNAFGLTNEATPPLPEMIKQQKHSPNNIHHEEDSTQQRKNPTPENRLPGQMMGFPPLMMRTDLMRHGPSPGVSDGEFPPPSPSSRSTPESMMNNTTVINSEGIPEEVCPLCNKTFRRKVYLKRHMEREHYSTPKVFQCQDCNYSTKHQSNLSVHRRTHTGERPYHCGCCGQRYTQGHLLKSHIRSRHAGDMTLYNLEKKSDSTRGRKSLDIKRDILSSPAAFPGAPTPYMKCEKIKSLLAQAREAKTANGGQSMNGMSNNSSSFMSPNYYNGPNLLQDPNSDLSKLMAATPYLPWMQAPGPAKDKAMQDLYTMTKQRMANGQLPSSSLYGFPMTYSGMVGLPATAPLLPQFSSMNGGTTTTPAAMMGNMRFPMKMPNQSVSPSELSPNKPQSASLTPTTPPSAQKAPVVEYAQDLSMKPRGSATPEGSVRSAQSFDQKMAEEEFMEIHPEIRRRYKNEQEDKKDMHYPNYQPQYPLPPPSGEIPTSRSSSAHHGNSAPAAASVFPGYETEEREDEENKAPAASQQQQQQQANLRHHQDLLTAAAAAAAVADSSPACPCPSGSKCSHETKLKELRKNVMRMLSVLVPNQDIDNEIDYATDQVDQLLNEVMYSNLEETDN